MIALDPFSQLLARLGANHGAPVLISSRELGGWPPTTRRLLKAKGLLVKARPASSTECCGCERGCVMPVHVVADQLAASVAFIVCDKRSDINRVSIPIDDLERWQVTVDAVADLLADLLVLRRPLNPSAEGGAWHLGLLKGANHSSYVKLLANGELTVAVGGHSLALSDLLELKRNQFIVDRRRLLRAVNNPVRGSADFEAASERQRRIRRRVKELKARGIKGFIKQVAAEELISPSRVKQILSRVPVMPKSKSADRSAIFPRMKEIK